MKKGLVRISTVGMTREKWLEERMYGIGGSDIAAVFGIDEYKPSIKLFHQKLGTWPTNEETNIAAYGGRVAEEFIYHKYWKYWDPNNNDKDIMVKNADADNIIRKASRVNAILYDPETPWIRANIDYRIHKSDEKDSGILELKKASGYYWNKYKAKIPPGYILQTNTYMGTAGYDWGEIFALKDGIPEMFSLKLNEVIYGSIKEKTKLFWDNILTCREIMADKTIPEDEKYMLIAEYEPDPENTEAYQDYMKDRYRSENHKGSMAASKSIEKARRKYWEHHEAAMIAEKNKRMEKNIILTELNKYKVSEIVLDDDKKISFFDRITIPKLDE